MLQLGLGRGAVTSGGSLRVLCLGAHSDDIEIGCGGTLLRLLEEHPGSHVDWVVFSATGARAVEAQRSADAFLASAGKAQVELNAFRESYFPYVAAEIKDAFERLKARTQPDLVLSHRNDDMHQDHRVIADLTW